MNPLAWSFLLKGALTVTLGVGACAYAASDQQDGPDLTKWNGFRWSGSNRVAYAALDKFSDCILKLKPSEARELIAMPEDGDKVVHFGSTLARSSQRCLDVISLKFSPTLFRQAMIGAVYREEIFKRHQEALSTPLGFDVGRIEHAKCIARRDFPNSEKLMGTAAGSSDERAVWTALGSHLVACRVSLQKLSGAQGLRYDLAEAVYRIRFASQKEAAE